MLGFPVALLALVGTLVLVRGRLQVAVMGGLWAGYLLYVKDRTLVAQPFDARSERFTGEPVPLVDGIGIGGNGLAHFSVSDHGALVYLATGGGATQLTWVDRAGKRLSAVGLAGDLGNPALSPDRRVMITESIWTDVRFAFTSSIRALNPSIR